MRIEVLTPRVEVVPGATCEIELEVFNTGDVIDTVTSRIVGSYPLEVAQRPAALSLFPGTSERMTMTFTLPVDYPAGDHLLPLEVVSAVSPAAESAAAEIEIDVVPVVKASIDLVPREMTAGRRARFSAHIANEGNTPVNLSLTGLDPERALAFSFDPVFVRVQPGQHFYVAVRTRGKRPLFGLPVARPFDIHADGPSISVETQGRVSQKPWISRGLITVATLAVIVALWAIVFMAGANLVVNKDKLAKTVPAAFLVGQQDFSTSAVAGSMTGSVVSSTDGKPVERMTIEAYRIRTGRQELAQSGASGADGSWKLEGVGPGRYHLRFSAPGFEDVWYPASPDVAGAGIVTVLPVAGTEHLDVKVTGLPGTISGAVAAGEQSTISGLVTVRPLVDDIAGDVVDLVTTAPDGSYSITGLPTPATYQLTVSLEGFSDQVITTPLGGGASQVVNTVQMAAGEGVLGGTVTSGGKPLGGVVVTVSGAGKTFTATTPTSGPVGTWSLAGLPTPATYIVTFALDGYGTETMALDLAAGETRGAVDVTLASGTGSIAGVVKDGSGTPLGDVTVTVTGSDKPITTKTLTTGAVGAYTLNGLPTPGRYTVTFSLDSYSSVTRAVTLSDSGSATGVDVTLAPSAGGIAGTITAGGKPAPGATVTVGDGRVEHTTVSADTPAGGYRFGGLAAGSYTVTVELTGYKKQTVLVDVAGGAMTTTDVALQPVTP